MKQQPNQWAHLYNKSRWRQLRNLQLSAEPLCKLCEEAGKVTAATVVDHIEPHRGDEKLFWDQENLRSLCTPCHEHLASVKDTTGIDPGCNVDGEPLDKNHPWYQGE